MQFVEGSVCLPTKLLNSTLFVSPSSLFKREPDLFSGWLWFFVTFLVFLQGIRHNAPAVVVVCLHSHLGHLYWDSLKLSAGVFETFT